MEIIVILVMSIITIITLTILSKFSLKKIKLIKKIGEDKKLNELTNTLPENEQIAKEILKKLKNDNVKIKTGGASSQASLYIVATNTIFIANIKLYWIIITILTLFNKIANPNIHAIILVMMSITLFFVRSYIETDAMTKARFLAKEYMESKKEVITKENIETIIENYDKINNIGIKFTNLSLIVEYLVKVIIYCVIALI